ncbi:hypothetical protein K456DRAFT_1725264 [Colletotrichum gloeosporioides 23]|nr:hypothetical protein K456DRAFT_1725264 [Colletotrichum gloeosporioides 23]
MVGNNEDREDALSHNEEFADPEENIEDLNIHNYSVSSEDGRNGMHVAVGGFFQGSEYKAQPIHGTNGYIGQARNLTAEGSLSLLPDDKLLVLDDNETGDQIGNGLHSLSGPNGHHTKAPSVEAPIEPFQGPNGPFCTSCTIANITKLGCTYGSSSCDI